MDDAPVELRRAPRRAPVDEAALVLEASGLHPQVLSGPEGFALWVPALEANAARAALAAFERENPPPARPAPPPPALDPAAIPHALGVVAALLAFFLVTGARRAGVVWFERGAADAARVRAGELWRTVTALTLHADLPHVVGNAAAGALFLAGVFRVFGFGVGAALVLLSGAAGNLANAVLRPGPHEVVGASTAVFGALGLLAGRGLVLGRGSGLRGRRAFVPVAAALALLAMIGTEGERADVWAHGFGLAAGLGLGALASGLGATIGSPRTQRLGGAAALAGIAGAWALALR
ncbi:MAG: rhomboid family intramembrane serine protease [Deltaproteobacteria bacterium]|nr:rhomboid family intramembrane serine protease [Deltaproteobacteria bacterium]